MEFVNRSLRYRQIELLELLTSVVGTVESAVLGTGDGVGAEGRVPLVTGVAVGVTADVVQPTPVGVEHD